MKKFNKYLKIITEEVFSQNTTLNPQGVDPTEIYKIHKDINDSENNDPLKDELPEHITKNIILTLKKNGNVSIKNIGISPNQAKRFANKFKTVFYSDRNGGVLMLKKK